MKHRSCRVPRAPRFPIELLESRIAPAVFHWNLPGTGVWNNAASWFNETTGQANDGFPNAIDDVAKLTNANTAGASVQINGMNVTVGALIFDDNNPYQILSLANGTLTFSSTGTASLTVSTTNGDASHVIFSPVILASPLRITQGATSLFSIATGISESVASMTVAKDGTGSLVFANTVGNPLPNTYTGATVVEEGALFVTKITNVNAVTGPIVVGGFGRDAVVNVANANQLPDTGSVTVNSQGTLNVNFAETFGALTINDGSVTLGPNANTLVTAASLNMTGGKIQLNVSNQIFLLNGNATVTSDVSGPALFTGGTLNLGAATRTLTVNDGPQAQDFIVSAAVSGAAGVGFFKSGSGTMRLAGAVANTYNGPTTVSTGTLELAKTSGNAIVGTLNVGDGAGGAEVDVLRLVNPNQIADPGTVVINGSGLLDTNGQFESIGTVNILGGHVTTGIGGANLSITAGLTFDSGRLTAGPGSQINLAAGIFVETTGPSLIDGQGSLGMFTSALNFNVSDGAAAVDLLVTVPINGAFGLNKIGTGTMELGAANTYSGDTLVFGTLIVNGSVGNVVLGSSQGTLAGKGTVGAISGGGNLRPGTSPGVLHTGSIAVSGSTPLFFEIDGAKPGNGPGFHDQLAVTGTVNLTNITPTFTITAGFSPGDQYKLLDNDGSDAVTGTFTGMPEGFVTTIGARRYILTYKGGDGNDVVFTPEQSFIIEGDFVPGSDDSFFVTLDATDVFLVHVTALAAAQSSRTFDVSLHQFANILIRGGEADDDVTFNANHGYFGSSFPNVFSALNFVGGTGDNSLTLTGGGPADQTAFEIYSSTGGPDQGLISVSSGFRVNFDQVGYYSDDLNVTDYFVAGAPGGATETLFFSGTDAFNSLAGVTGHVPVHLHNKNNVVLFGNGGGDTYNVGTTISLAPPSTVTITAGTDQVSDVNVLGTNDGENFKVTTTSPTEGSVARAGQPTVNFTGQIRIAIDGAGGADTFDLPSTNIDARITGGGGADHLTFASGTAGISLNFDQTGIPQALNGSGQITLGDTLESITGTGQTDAFYAKASPLARSITGGAGNDTLVFDALGASAANVAGIISTPGFGSLSTGAIEGITLLNVPAKPAFGAQGNTFAAPLDFVVGKNPNSLAVGDLNGDGKADFVTANGAGNSISIALSTGTGLLVPAVQKTTGGKKPTGVTLGDFDGINGLDIAITNAATRNVAILLNDGAGNFGAPTLFATGKTPGVLRAGDLDGDGDLDLVTLTAGNKLVVLKNNAAAFTAAAPVASGALKAKDLALANLDADNDLDVAVLHTGGELAVRLNNGTGTLGTPAVVKTGLGATAFAIADFNGDGKLDAAVTHNAISRFVGLALGKGDGTFLPLLRTAYPIAGKASALVAGDFDGDGKTDLAIANGTGGRVNILRSLGTGGFVRAMELVLEDTPARKLAALALGDFDGDGRADLAALSFGSSEVSIVTRA